MGVPVGAAVGARLSVGLEVDPSATGAKQQTGSANVMSPGHCSSEIKKELAAVSSSVQVLSS